MTAPIIMQPVYKIFKMKKNIFLLVLLYTSTNVISQVIPVGTVIKGKRLPTLLSDNLPNEDNSNATLYGSIRINDSKLSIIENGFVYLPSSDSRTPDVINSTKVIVASGIANFEITISSFSSNTSYKYRAYAKNSRGEFAYSQQSTFTTFKNYCEYNYCKNSGICSSTSFGAICRCTINFCGDCCAQGADISCPGGGDQICSLSWLPEPASSALVEKNRFQNSIIKSTSTNSIWAINTNLAILNTNTH